MASLVDTKQRLVAYVLALGPTLDTNPGTVLDDLISAFAASETDTLSFLESTQAQSFLGTASGVQLTAKSSDYGVFRAGAVASTTTVVFSRAQADPVNVTTIPLGTLVQTTPGPGSPAIVFSTTAVGSIAAGSTSSPAIGVQAVVAGKAGNVGAGLINLIPVSISGAAAVTVVTNASAASGGADAETDAALLGRTLNNMTANNSPYIIAAAAQGVAGIANASVYDWRDGLGNYTCYAADSSGNLSGALNTAVTTAIAAVDGIGLNRHVQAFATVPITIVASVAINTSFVQATVLANIQSAINAWMASLKPGQAFLPYDLHRAVAGAVTGIAAVQGVNDFFVTTPSAPTAITTYQIATYTPGSATLNVVAL